MVLITIEGFFEVAIESWKVYLSGLVCVCVCLYMHIHMLLYMYI